jgi:hypothetical protein
MLQGSPGTDSSIFTLAIGTRRLSDRLHLACCETIGLSLARVESKMQHCHDQKLLPKRRVEATHRFPDRGESLIFSASEPLLLSPCCLCPSPWPLYLQGAPSASSLLSPSSLLSQYLHPDPLPFPPRDDHNNLSTRTAAVSFTVVFLCFCDSVSLRHSVSVSASLCLCLSFAW